MNDANPKMPDANKCPQCGTPLKSPALGGLCPACLLAQGAVADTVTDAKQPPFVPPSVNELAPLFPQLEILELIGKGGMGAVYKARQKELDRIVALKILPPGIGETAGFAERFTREAKALAKLNHPNIVTIHDFGRAELPLGLEAAQQRSPTEKLYFFVMEFVDGVNLRQLLETGRVAAHEALAIVPQICDALQFAHDHGIVHRDIKPENILMDRRGRVKVADFGLAKLVGVEGRARHSVRAEDSQSEDGAHGVTRPTSDLTESGKVMGTPQYMAPEQKDRPLEVDHRADIYALGVVFYQMLTGELPGKRIEAPSKKVQIDVRLDEIVLRALENKPELRYQQASVFKTQVENVASSPSVSEAKASSIQKMLNVPSLGLIVISSLSLLVLAVAIPLWVFGAFLNIAGKTVNMPWAFGIPVLLLMAGFNIVSLTGAWRMRHLRSHTLAIVGSILFMLAPGLGLALANACKASSSVASTVLSVLLTFLFGIWALIVLSRKEVREAFATNPKTLPNKESVGNVPSRVIVFTIATLIAAIWGYFVDLQNNEPGWFIGRLILVPMIALGIRALLTRSSPAKNTNVGGKTLSGLILAIVLALLLRTFVVGIYYTTNDAVSPEIPRGSWVLVFKLARSFDPGDAIVYRYEKRNLLGRVIGERHATGFPDVVFIERQGETPQEVRTVYIIGKVIFNTRANAAIAQPILMDENKAIYQGEWDAGSAASDKFGNSYLYCPAASALPQASATFRPLIKTPGKYDVEIWYPQGTNRSAHAWWIISCADGESRVLVDQTTNGGQWIKIADNQSFAAGTNGFIRLVNKTPGFNLPSGSNVVVADAVRLVPPNPNKKLMVSENFTPEYIVAATLEKYKSLSSFRADSVELTEMRYDDDPKLHLINGQCSIQMTRPYYLRFIQGEKNSTNAIKDVVWSNEDGAFQTAYFGVEKLKNHKDTQIENVQYTLDWKNPKPVVSELFFDIHYNWLSQMTRPVLEPEAKIDGDDCFVISVGKTMVWIRKKDFLVKQKREENNGIAASPPTSINSTNPAGLRILRTPTLRLDPTVSPPAVVNPPVDPLGLRAIPSRTLRQFPASAPTLSPLPPQGIITPQQPTSPTAPSRTFSMRRTQTFRQIVVNEPLQKENFSHASIPLLSDRNDPKARRNLAQALMLSGKNEQALEEFMWCWDHGKKDKDFRSKRIGFLLSDISKFGTKYPPAFDALRKRRDAIEEKLLNGKEGSDEIDDLFYLNSNLKDSERTVALFDRMPANSPVRQKLSGRIVGQLIEAKRYDDILTFLDPEKALEDAMVWRQRDLNMQQRISMPSSSDEYSKKRFRDSGAQYFEVLAGAKKTERAKKMAEKILEFDSTPDAQVLLEKAAIHAGNQELVNYLQSKNEPIQK